MSRKFWLVLIVTIGLMALAAAWIVIKMFDTSLWIAWFGGMSANVAGYEAANVAQKKTISKNYRPELDK